jgi:pimeloyl-ACP methyl ester carboxylesterase
MSPDVNRFVFLHGGPGFNSFAEQAILGPPFQRGGHTITFWNEPSRLRADGESFEPAQAFMRWLASAEAFLLRASSREPVHLLAHSFAVHAALEIARRCPERLASLVLIVPGVDAFSTFTNVLRLAQRDLADVNAPAASAIAESLTCTRRVLDEAMHAGMMNALLDDRLFTHYFVDPRQLEACFACYARPDAQFDAESFFAVLRDFGNRRDAVLLKTAVTIPTLALFGTDDPITPLNEQRAALEAAAPGVGVRMLEGCSHYAHLDRPQQFVDTVVEWVRARP